MSVSKLESLPNEILTIILEKYINGIDVLNAFAFQLNRRFDALIAGCYRLRFDFVKCHKYDFRFSMGLLPGYIDKIEELALSDQYTPGQIHAFLSFFPSLSLFKRLGKLNFDISDRTVQPRVVELALYSLRETTLHTLCIKITDKNTAISLNYMIVEIFGIKTLKKFSMTCRSYNMNWSLLNVTSSNIEYLTMYGIPFILPDLKYIFQSASGLKYMDVQIVPVTHYINNKSKSSSEDVVPKMSMLHTVILKIKGNYSSIVNELGTYLRCMPSLNCLEIYMHDTLNDLSVLETLLKTSAPTLSYFNLIVNPYSSVASAINKIRESIQTPFWIEKKNFSTIIKAISDVTADASDLYDAKTTLFEPEHLVYHWWIGPQRKLSDNVFATNQILSITLSTDSSSCLQDHYLNNVNRLVVEELNDNLLHLIIKHVNCSRIRQLDVILLPDGNDKISSLLPYIKNISSIRITLNQLSDNRFAYLKECMNLKFLDISADQHSFDEKHIFIIANMFPNIEHLTINTEDLQNVPILQTYIPRLRSLTFVDIEPTTTSFFDNYKEERADAKLRQEAQFLFQRRSNRITVWIDEAALQDNYWNNITLSVQQSSDGSWSD